MLQILDEKTKIHLKSEKEGRGRPKTDLKTTKEKTEEDQKELKKLERELELLRTQPPTTN